MYLKTNHKKSDTHPMIFQKGKAFAQLMSTTIQESRDEGEAEGEKEDPDGKGKQKSKESDRDMLRKSLSRSQSIGLITKHPKKTVAAEESEVGSVSWKVYQQYASAIGGAVLVAGILWLYALDQAAQGMSSW